MMTGLPVLAVVAAFAAFGAAGAVLALIGGGVPFLIAALLASACAGLLVFGVGKLLSQPDEHLAQEMPGVELEARVRLLEDSSAEFRHDLRGVLSPALMMADRLLRNEDPSIQRAGQAVVRSVERATKLIVENKRASLVAAGEGARDAAPTTPRSPPAETGARAG